MLFSVYIESNVTGEVHCLDISGSSTLGMLMKQVEGILKIDGELLTMELDGECLLGEDKNDTLETKVSQTLLVEGSTIAVSASLRYFAREELKRRGLGCSDDELCKVIQEVNRTDDEKYEVTVLMIDAEPKPPMSFTRPFWTSVYEGCPKTAEALSTMCEYGIYFNDDGQFEGLTPLHVACKNTGQVFTDIAATLVLKGADVNAKASTTGKRPLHLAVDGLNVETVRLLLSCRGISPNAVDNDGTTPLFLASANRHGQRHEGIAKMLIAKGADVNAATRLGDRPLHGAVKNTSDSLARLLVENGADPNVFSHNGLTPLHTAIVYRRLPTVMMLLCHGADLHAVSKGAKGITPLQAAVMHGYTNSEILQLRAMQLPPLF